MGESAHGGLGARDGVVALPDAEPGQPAPSRRRATADCQLRHKQRSECIVLSQTPAGLLIVCNAIARIAAKQLDCSGPDQICRDPGLLPLLQHAAHQLHAALLAIPGAALALRATVRS